MPHVAITGVAASASLMLLGLLVLSRTPNTSVQGAAVEGAMVDGKGNAAVDGDAVLTTTVMGSAVDRTEVTGAGVTGVILGTAVVLGAPVLLLG